MDEERIWEKQEYESEHAYSAFSNYFLQLPAANRTVTEAWRNYLRVNGRKNDRAPASSTWKRWSRGETVKDGKTLKLNVPTWHERANAYDEYENKKHFSFMEEARLDIMEDEYRDYQKQLNVWTDIVDKLQQRIDFETKRAEEKSVAFDPRDFVRPLGELVKQRDTISILGRRARGMPTVISEDRLRNADDEKPLEIVWKEPEYKESEIGKGNDIITDYLRRKNASKQDAGQ